MGMKSGKDDAQIRACEKVVGNDGHTWLWNSADYIYVTAFKDPERRGEGFGGSTLNIPLKDGGTFALHGGWHTNSDALFRATGVDLRNEHLTRGCVALRFEYRDKHLLRPTMIGILHVDADWVSGPFDRLKHIAQRFANERGVRIHYYAESQGGSSRSWTDPDKPEVQP